MRESSCSRNDRRHLRCTLEYPPHDRSHNGKGEEETQRSGHGETFSYPHKETHADPSSQTDKGDVSGLEMTAHHGSMVRVRRGRGVYDVAIVGDLLFDVLVGVGLVATRSLHVGGVVCADVYES
jgi:hypothetical protein